uniref:Uncharacterized protein n=1 Tax=Lygus hesperus TaxID=30085 RepID=A0A0A9WM32_LYGHE
MLKGSGPNKTYNVSHWHGNEQKNKRKFSSASLLPVSSTAPTPSLTYTKEKNNITNSLTTNVAEHECNLANAVSHNFSNEASNALDSGKTDSTENTSTNVVKGTDVQKSQTEAATGAAANTSYAVDFCNNANSNSINGIENLR